MEHPDRFGITRVWKVQETATGGRWSYEVSSGMSPKRVREMFVASLPLLRAFNPYARYLANFRDHALLVYGKPGIRPRPESRQFPRSILAAGMDSEGHKEIVDGCKSGITSVGDPSAAPVAGDLTAQQIAEFFANDPDYGGRYVLTGN
jgi:hypothetical protein